MIIFFKKLKKKHLLSNRKIKLKLCLSRISPCRPSRGIEKVLTEANNRLNMHGLHKLGCFVSAKAGHLRNEKHKQKALFEFFLYISIS